MRTQQVATDLNRRKGRELGDGPIIESATKTSFYKYLVTKPLMALFSLLRDNLIFLFNAMAFTAFLPFMFRPGKRRYGFIFLFGMLICMMGYNFYYFWDILRPFTFFAIPWLRIWFEWKEIPVVLYLNVNSVIYWYYMVGCFALGFLHILAMYLGFSNKESKKTGESWLYHLLKRVAPFISEYAVQGVIQPLIILLGAYLVWEQWQDKWLVIWISASAICAFAVHASERAFQEKDNSIMDTGSHRQRLSGMKRKRTRL